MTDMDIDIVKLAEDVRQLAKDRPDYVYPQSESGTCYYFWTDGSPACIIGHALVKQGVEIGHLSESDNHAEFSVIADEILDIDPDYEPVLWAWLCAVQSHQDQHKPWSEAIALADTQRYEA